MTRTEVRAILDDINYPGYSFKLTSLTDGGMLMFAAYTEADIDNPKLSELQITRKWYISQFAVRGEIVQTALKCILTSMEHRVREHFTYRNQRVFGPHFNIDALAKVCERGEWEHRS